jgi:A/G-specific adenine glycosylase
MLAAGHYNQRIMSELSSSLLEWYANAGRDLPWRKTQAPYAIWISEIMLQQTRVDTVIPYYERWMARFPDIRSLAEADIDEVLRLWEGLGYYQRAHHLRQAAVLLHEREGIFPEEVEDLRALPGIGPYTANAIAAIAFNQQVIALDGNLRRVLARLFCFDQDPKTPDAERTLSEKALASMPSGKAAEFNQALMDLGAEICAPRSPNCAACPLQMNCEAYLSGRQDELPIRKPKKKIPHHVLAAGVVKQNGEVLLTRRPSEGLLGGLWEFPNGQCHPSEAVENCLLRTLRAEVGIEPQIEEHLGTFSHAYSHFKVTVHAVECSALENSDRIQEHDRLKWIPIEELSEFPMGKVDRAIARVLGGNHSSSHHQKSL